MANENTTELGLTATGEVRSKNDKQFQARVFVEKESNVYGAEIILFDSDDEEINRILITDATEFDKLNDFLKNIQKAYIPYTTEDVNIIDTLSSNEQDSEAYITANNNWSDLSKKKDLKTILENKIQDGVTPIDTTDYIEDGYTIINSTHLNGFDSSKFLKEADLYERVKDMFLERSHSTTKGVNDNLGHVILTDNLTTDGVGEARVLSANQGRILNESIQSAKKKFEWDGSGFKTLKGHSEFKYKVNPSLKLVTVIYTKKNFTGFKKKAQNKELLSKNTFPYKPHSPCVFPLPRGDVSLIFYTNGSVSIKSLTKISSMNINLQVMFHYK